MLHIHEALGFTPGQERKGRKSKGQRDKDEKRKREKGKGGEGEKASRLDAVLSGVFFTVLVDKRMQGSNPGAESGPPGSALDKSCTCSTSRMR